MKTLRQILIAIFTVTLFSTTGFSQTAKVQVIHNSADLAAEMVDVYLNDDLLLDDFMFRTASPFIEAPASEEFTISIAASNSVDNINAIAQFNFMLEADQTYILVANGIVDTETYPDQEPFNIYAYDMARQAATDESNTDVLVFHGSTDAPIVDVVEVAAGAGTIVNNAAYGDFAGYLELPTADYSLQVRNEMGNTTVAQYAAPLSALELDGSALTVLASGFLNTNANKGAGFGLFVALPSGGDLIALPAEEISTARVQVIHNSADVAAEVVDVYLNETLLLDDFMFRTASPFIDAPAGEEFTISIAAPNSTDISNAIAQFNYTLEGGKKYMLIANGIVDTDNYFPAEPFNIYVYDMAREMASEDAQTDVIVFHGSTDAPMVDVVEVAAGAGTIVNNTTYGDFAGYLELPTSDYSLQVRDMYGSTIVAQFAAPLAALELQGQALAVVASGFLNTANNYNGEAFGLFVALPSGGDLIALPAEEISTARVQVIHNSPDILASSVDIYLNDNLLLDDFTFRSASPFLDAPAGEEFTISIATSNSVDTTGAVVKYNYALEGGKKYILIASGLMDNENYPTAEPFNLYAYDMAREYATADDNTDVLVFHGAVDAPTVDVQETGLGAGTIVNDLQYGTFAGYLELETSDYQLTITDDTGESAVAVFDAPMETLALQGQAITVVASGFLSPVSNSDASFGLYVALNSGGDLIPLANTTTTDIREQTLLNLDWKIYPNPTTDYVNISFGDVGSDFTIRTINITGQVMEERKVNGEKQIQIDLSDYNNGIYLMTIQSGDAIQSKKLQVVK